jgi:hypothetical protein
MAQHCFLDPTEDDRAMVAQLALVYCRELGADSEASNWILQDLTARFKRLPWKWDINAPELEPIPELMKPILRIFMKSVLVLVIDFLRLWLREIVRLELELYHVAKPGRLPDPRLLN